MAHPSFDSRLSRFLLGRRSFSCLLDVLLLLASLLASPVSTLGVVTSVPSASSLAGGTDGIYQGSALASTVASTLLMRAASAYTVDHSDFALSVYGVTMSADLQTEFLGGGYDFALVTNTMTSQQTMEYPDISYYPFLGSALVAAYNFPDTAGATQLILPILVICDIERGNVTYWNDSRIIAANPNLDIPDIGITVFHLSIESSSNDAIISMCRKISPEFASLIPRTTEPDSWPTDRYYSHGWGSSSEVLASHVIDTVGGYSMMTLQNAVNMGTTYTKIKRIDGVVVSPSQNAIALNMIELAGQSLEAGQANLDLTDPVSPDAWPVCSLIYLWIDTANAVTTCATKTLMLEFLLYLYTDSSVADLAAALNMVIAPSLYLTASDLIATLEADIQCKDSTLIGSSTTTGYVEGFGSIAQLIGSFSSYYTAVDSTYTYEFDDASETLATNRIVANEINLAIVNTRQVSEKDLVLLTEDGEGALLPAFITGTVITFTLPTTIQTAWAAWSSTTSSLPQLLPLTINLETAAKIFTAQVTNWTDPALLATSPQLAEWFAAYPSVSTAFTPVVCCTSSTDPLAAGTMLLQGLNQTTTALSASYSAYFAAPISWTEQAAAYPDFFTLIDIEARMSAKATGIQALGGSTISYRQITVANTDTSSEFQISQTTSAGVTEIVTPEPSNFETCASVGFASSDFSTPSYTPSVIAGCYPLNAALSYAVNLVFTDDDCTNGNYSLNFLQYLLNTDALSDAALNAGVYRMADDEDILDASNVIIDAATCDGTTLLVTLPTVWRVSVGVTDFGIAVCVVAFLMLAASAVVLVLYRHRTVLRSSSVPFLSLVLLGLTLLAASIAVWSITIREASCHSFMWLVSLGFSLVFVPFLAKTYRIYLIFNRRQLRVVKVSNRKLLAVVGVVLLVEVALMIVWSQVSPLKPITYTRNISDSVHQATLCSVDDTGMVFVVIETVYKGLLLLAGSVLAFRTRKVSSAFNETVAVAFSIYNVFFSSIIIGLIIYFVDAFEDTLILLMLFLLFWVTYATWALLFGTKFYALFSQTEAEAVQASRINSLQVEKSQGGFSFVSVASMPANMIKGYVAALEVQMLKAKKQLAVVLGTTGHGIGISARLPSPVLMPLPHSSHISISHDPSDAAVGIIVEEPESEVLLQRRNLPGAVDVQHTGSTSVTVAPSPYSESRNQPVSHNFSVAAPSPMAASAGSTKRPPIHISSSPASWPPAADLPNSPTYADATVSASPNTTDATATLQPSAARPSSRALQAQQSQHAST